MMLCFIRFSRRSGMCIASASFCESRSYAENKKQDWPPLVLKRWNKEASHLGHLASCSGSSVPV
jgi:hypothetical protein